MTGFSFVVTSHGGKYAKVSVRVFDDQESMLRSMRAYHRKIGVINPSGWYRDSLALSSPRARKLTTQRSWRHEVVIRLIADHCNSHIVSHEATHAALYLYREQVQKTIPDMEREEILCHLVSEIVEEMTYGLYEAGIWERVA